jgi:hypothetical protein
MTNLFQALYEPFPKEVERTLSKSGTRLTYIPVSEVITRLNKVLGLESWSYEILSCLRDSLDPDFVVAHVRLDAKINGELVSRDGIGGQKIKRTKQGEIVDLGDEFKGAVSDALKKAAQSLGVGLYLARTEEALMMDEAEQAPVVNEEIVKLWTNFLSLSKSLSEDKRKKLSEFWLVWAEGAPKPTLETATFEDLEALIAEATRLKFEEGSESDDAGGE